MKPVRVLVVGQVPPPVHGSNVMCERLLACLAGLQLNPELIDKGFSTSISEVGRFGLAKPLRAMAFLRRTGRATASPRSVAGAIVFLSCTAGSFLIEQLAVRRLRRSGIPILLYLHGIGFRSLAARGAVWERIVRGTFAAAHRVVVLGESAAEDVRPFTDALGIRTIPNFVPDTRVGAMSRDRRREGLRVLFLSNLDPSKGAELFLNAARVVARRYPSTEFWLAGQALDRNYEATLRGIAAEPPLKGRVRFLGGVFAKEKLELIRAADLLAYPSMKENQPLVILEAMAEGLPVVASRVGCIPEEVEHGVTGFIVEPCDVDGLATRVLAFCEDPGLGARLGSAGRRRYETLFREECFERRWADVLTELQPVEPR